MSDPAALRDLSATATAPISDRGRVDVIDCIRGLAVYGILVMNMDYFAWPKARNWPVYLIDFTSTADAWMHFWLRVVFKGKFYLMFTFLFGLGMAVQKQGRPSTAGFSAFFSRRMCWLMLIGALHGLFIWHGDILLIYALVGFSLMLWQNAQPRTCLIWAGTLLLGHALYQYVPMLSAALAQAADAEGTAAAIKSIHDLEQLAQTTYASSLETYTHGSWWAVAELRFAEYTGLVLSLHAWYVDLLISCLMGIWAWRAGIFTRPEDHRALLRRVVLYAGTLGLVLNIVGFFIADLHLYGLPRVWMSLCAFFGKYCLSYAYVAFLVLAWQAAAFRRLFSRLAPVGRMALTNYLTHSLVLTLFFNGYGLGQMARFGDLQVWLISCALFGTQITISAWWLDRYRFGPVEWLWRSLTYRGLQPMRR